MQVTKAYFLSRRAGKDANDMNGIARTLQATAVSYQRQVFTQFLWFSCKVIFAEPDKR